MILVAAASPQLKQVSYPSFFLLNGNSDWHLMHRAWFAINYSLCVTLFYHTMKEFALIFYEVTIKFVGCFTDVFNFGVRFIFFKEHC